MTRRESGFFNAPDVDHLIRSHSRGSFTRVNDLAERARMTVPHAVVVEFQMFLGDPAFDRLEQAIKEGSEIRG